MAKNNVVGSVSVKVNADKKGFNSQVPMMAKDFKSGFTSALGKLGLGIGIATVVRKGMQEVTESVKTAIDAVEIESFFEQALGDLSAEARAWSDDLQSTLGLNAVEMRENVATIFRMTEAMGAGRKEALGMSKSIVELAGDLASAKNVEFDVALAKLRSGLVGQSKPLKEWGFVLDASVVKQHAYTQGIAQMGEELTQAQKVQARFNKIMELTQTEQGDLARTIKSPANQLRLLNAQIDIIRLNIGKALLPVIENILPKIVEFTRKWAEAANAMNKTKEAINSLAGTTSKTSEESAGSINEETKAINEQNKALKGGLAGFDELNTLKKQSTKTSTPIQKVTEQPFDLKKMKDVSPIKKVKEEILDATKKVGLFKEALTKTNKDMKQTFSGLSKVLVAPFKAMFGLGRIIKGVLKEDEKIIDKGLNIIGESISMFFEGLITVLIGSIKTLFNLGFLIGFKIGNMIFNTLQKAFNKIRETISMTIKKVVDFFTILGGNIFKKMVEIKNNIVLFFTSAIEKAIEVFGNLKETVVGIFSKIGKSITSAWENIKKSSVSIFSSIGETIVNVWDGVKKTTVSIFDTLVDLIKKPINAIIGLFNTVISAWNRIEFEVPEVNVPYVGTFGGFSVGVSKIRKIPKLTSSSSLGGGNQTSQTQRQFADQLSSSVTSGFLQSRNFLAPAGVQDREVVLNVDGKNLGRVLIPNIQSELNRRGRNTTVRAVGGGGGGSF